MQAKDIMTRSVVSIDPRATVLQAIRIMLQRKISGLPVVDRNGHLVGILTEGDLLRRNETGTERQRPRWLNFLIGPGRLADEYTHSHGRLIDEVMTTDPITVQEDTPLDEIVGLMEKHRIKRLPVVQGRNLVGIISRANLLHAIASVAGDLTPVPRGDAAIRERFMAELEKQNWAPRALINPMVRNGIVDLWGSITDERERQALIVAAENIPGVKGVRDHLTWVEPHSGIVFYPPEAEENVKAPD